MRISRRPIPTDLFVPFTMTELPTNTIRYLEESSVERDLGVLVKNNVKWDELVKSAAAKANKALGTLQRTFKCWDTRMLKQLFVAYVRPHLEYAIQSWRPYNQLDIDRLEKVQQRATRLVQSLRVLDYDTRLEVLDLPSLTERWNRADAIQMFKFSRNSSKINWLNPFTSKPAQPGPCGNTRQIDWFAKERCSTSQREHFFRNRVVGTWNTLPIVAKTATSINCFKNAYDEHITRIKLKQKVSRFPASIARQVVSREAS